MGFLHKNIRPGARDIPHDLPPHDAVTFLLNSGDRIPEGKVFGFLH